MKKDFKGMDGKPSKSGAHLIPHEEVRDRLLADPETKFLFDQLQAARRPKKTKPSG